MQHIRRPKPPQSQFENFSRDTVPLRLKTQFKLHHHSEIKSKYLSSRPAWHTSVNCWLFFSELHFLFRRFYTLCLLLFFKFAFYFVFLHFLSSVFYSVPVAPTQILSSLLLVLAKDRVYVVWSGLPVFGPTLFIRRPWSYLAKEALSISKKHDYFTGFMKCIFMCQSFESFLFSFYVHLNVIKNIHDVLVWHLKMCKMFKIPSFSSQGRGLYFCQKY